ncbi:MAG: DUF4956 domain-containing protein [Lachnospiraceae bacterium]|nr:DUF4956 domain-containing protein [Lachnospiraceae bacterium]
MTFQDIFKSSFLEKAVTFSPMDLFIAMVVAFALGLFIFFVYKKTFHGIMYSANFGVSLIALTLITTLVILAVTSNVVLSLGMVGALSIVRFRTAIKEPMDIAYLFWAIGVGIVIGAGLIPMAVYSSLFIGIILIVFVNRKVSYNPYLMIIHCESDETEQKVWEQLKEKVKKSLLKSKTVSTSGIELTVEVRLKDGECGFVNQIGKLIGVSNAVLVSYHGDYMG